MAVGSIVDGGCRVVERCRKQREQQEVPDDELDGRAAVEGAYLEQRRQPVDLMQAYAA